ncbi:MAG: hypothetical protein CDV28_11545 [Candidatus Electronema aureum]|uniref:Polymorphic outer membrane protein repeat-containing protein n=1 Tax=Candidatus Electronema aureum TaxID=2005002 RepID=A0A521G1L5_9BACT|nr:MAG: hypothetical protein CDV28_11545 [Candidatus Electronema aureum]
MERQRQAEHIHLCTEDRLKTPLKGLLFLAALLMAVGTAQAATITVDIGGACTLADAITAANTDTATGGCVAGAGDDTITLETDITLAAALPTITSTVIIEGGYYFISGNNNSSVGTVLRVANSGNLILNQVIVTRGYNSTSGLGGGIYTSGGTVTLNNSTVSENSISSSSSSAGLSYSEGGGIYSYSGTVTLNNSTVSGNSVSSSPPSSDFICHSEGGGIYSYSGTVTLNNSTVSGNSVSSSVSSSSSFLYYSKGGGIYSSGTVTLNNSTVSGNSVSSPVSSSSFFIYYSGGGGIYSDGTITLNDSTVSGNSASSSVSSSSFIEYYGGGGGIYSGGTMMMNHSTVSVNYISMSFSSLSGVVSFSGGGIYSGGGAAILRSSLVSGNTAMLHGPDFAASNSNEVQGTVTADGHNLFGHSGETSAQAFSSYNFTPGSSDITATSDGTKPTALAAILSPLADNGGATKTHALPAGSPAIDLDTTCSTGLTIDQRGYPRPVGSGCDAGSFEYGSVRTVTGINMAPIYKLLLFKRR